jgi:hypothetical protein
MEAHVCHLVQDSHVAGLLLGQFLPEGKRLQLQPECSRDLSLPAGNVQVVASAGGGFDVLLSYTYAEEFSGKSFGVSVSDTGGASTGVSASPFGVADAALTAGALTPPSATEGQALSPDYS